jgi:hypothetical protein
MHTQGDHAEYVLAKGGHYRSRPAHACELLHLAT